MDATELLIKDHREARALFQRFPTESSEEQRRTTAEDLIRELSRHDAVEVQFLYPVLREQSQEGDKLAEHSLDEHREAREMLTELDRNLDQVMSATFEATWAKLEAAIEEHVAEEEQQIFPLLRQRMSSEQLNELGDKIEKGKKTAPTRPHPTTPDNPVGATVMGAAAGMVDRARDAVSGRSES